eukprot:gb/GECG01014981.1/.p1 GENE.gb/GECG01014981.1/~~gb/GECG01014981.1/.p1  ORF type:complete len:444 (+),score=24.70 gb/GECG01014981.1/:1-1332(+)
MTSSVKPNFGWIFLAQVLSAGGELFGQRAGRKLHQRSNLKSAVAVVVYSALQAFLILMVLELAIPHVTKGQGSLSMWKQIYDNPGLLINAVNNTVYWLALIFVLREPLGVVMVVLAFLVASFFINPFSAIVGLKQPNDIDALSVFLGIAGALACLLDVPLQYANKIVVGRLPETVSSRGSSDSEELLINSEDGHVDEDTIDEDGSLGYDDTDRDRTKRLSRTRPSSAAISTTNQTDTETSFSQDSPQKEEERGGSDKPKITSLWAVATAFAILAFTAGIGIVITDYFEKRRGLNMFGYAAVDQVLLPFTTLPVLWLCNRYSTLRRVVGEPAGEPVPFVELLRQTWNELQFTTLVPFRGLMFGREFVFFYLVTNFDISATYLEMTLLRVILCWIASLLACTLLRKWVGVEKSEARTAVHPVNLFLKLGGTVLVLCSILRLNNKL